jgi:hypothetical protein
MKTKKGMTIVIVLLVLIFILNIIDYVQTVYAIRFAGIGVEANPIGRFMFKNNYEWLKLIGVPLALAVMGIIIRTDRRFILAAYYLLIWYVCVITHNFAVLFQMGIL